MQNISSRITLRIIVAIGLLTFAVGMALSTVLFPTHTTLDTSRTRSVPTAEEWRNAPAPMRTDRTRENDDPATIPAAQDSLDVASNPGIDDVPSGGMSEADSSPIENVNTEANPNPDLGVGPIDDPQPVPTTEAAPVIEVDNTPPSTTPASTVPAPVPTCEEAQSAVDTAYADLAVYQAEMDRLNEGAGYGPDGRTLAQHQTAIAAAEAALAECEGG